MAKKSQELKEKILNNLTEWSMDPASSFYKSKELSRKKFDSLEDYWYSDKKKETKDSVIGLYWFTESDYCEIKRAMINEIKQNPQDWNIEKEGSSLIIYKHKSGRKHYEGGFASKEKDHFALEGIEEIKNAIEKKERIQDTTKQRSQIEQTPSKSNIWVFSIVVLIIVIISLFLLVLFPIVRNVKKIIF
jgi:hypothetical protein